MCLAYRSFVEVKIVKIAKNYEKRRKTEFWQDEYSLVAFLTSQIGLGKVTGCILWTKTKQNVPIRKVCLVYRASKNVKIAKIAKNDEKRAFGRINRAL